MGTKTQPQPTRLDEHVDRWWFVQVVWFFLPLLDEMKNAVWLAPIFQVPQGRGGKLRVLSSSATCRHLHQDFDNILSSLMTFFKLAVGETHFFRGMLGKFFAQNMAHMLHVWNMYLHLALNYGNTWSSWDSIKSYPRNATILTNNQFLTDKYFAPLLGGGYMFHPYLGKWSILT